MATSSSATATSSSATASSTTDCITQESSLVDSDSSSDSEASRVVVSLLDRLKSPAQAEIGRSRKIIMNVPPRGKRVMGLLQQIPKEYHPSQRVKEFKDEKLTVSNSKLFCSACREHLGLKRSVIANHVRSNKHTLSKAKILSKEKQQQDIAEKLKKYNQETHKSGEAYHKINRYFEFVL